MCMCKSSYMAVTILESSIDLSPDHFIIPRTFSAVGM